MTEGFSTVTELPGVGAHADELSMLYTRYHFASQYTEGKEVLEVACGPGQGLGYLAKNAKRVVGGDIDENCLRFAQDHYADDERQIELLKLDAQNLPFEDNSFDTVLMFEAIYFLPDTAKFIKEAKRILRPGGIVLIVTVNNQWSGQHPAPFSTKYYSANELHELLSSEGFAMRLFVGFPDEPAGLIRRMISRIRKIAVALHLLPKTMKGKEFLKRLFYGKLAPLPAEVTDGMAPLESIREITGNEPFGQYRILYVAGTLQEQQEKG